MGEQSIIHLVADRIQQTWEVSTPEVVNDRAGTRFLGMELWRSENGTWQATQIGYTTDLLRRNLGEDQEVWQVRKVPAAKDIEEMVEEGKTPQQVKMAQKVVGELILLVTRCRPDLMYSVSRMASGITRMPRMVVQMAKQIWMYLANTLKYGLVFKNHPEENSLNVFSRRRLPGLFTGSMGPKPSPLEVIQAVTQIILNCRS